MAQKNNLPTIHQQYIPVAPEAGIGELLEDTHTTVITVVSPEHMSDDACKLQTHFAQNISGQETLQILEGMSADNALRGVRKILGDHSCGVSEISCAGLYMLGKYGELSPEILGKFSWENAIKKYSLTRSSNADDFINENSSQVSETEEARVLSLLEGLLSQE